MANTTKDEVNALRVARAGLAYFLLVFAVGFALAPIRELWLAPRFSYRIAELLEMPVMLFALILAACWTVSRFSIGPRIRLRLALGGIALGCLLLAELAVVSGVRSQSLGEYAASRDPVSGSVYLLMLGVFALLPALVKRRG